MSDQSWISRLFGRGGGSSSNHSNASPTQSSSPQTALPHRSPRIQTDDLTSTSLLKDITTMNGYSSASPPTTSTRNLMYFSPESALNRQGSSANDDALTVDTGITRKRQLTSFSPEQNNSLLASSRIKRFRDGMGNSSLMDAPSSRPSIPSRFDLTWAGGTDSPASSTQSLRSRVSLAPSAETKLSSKTRAILEQLERVSTPSSAAHKLPHIRSSATERWCSPMKGSASAANKSLSASAATPPPLKRQSLQVPSRVQVISSAMASHYKKPYWRDFSRNTPSKATTMESTDSPVNKTVQSVKSSQAVKVSPLFDLRSDEPTLAPVQSTDNGRKVVLKGADGKNQNKNTFNANALYESDEDEDRESEYAPPQESIQLPKFAAPSKGFLSDAIFEFAAPAKRGPEEPLESSSSESEESESDSDESEASEDSGRDEVHEMMATKEKTKITGIATRPATSATLNSETSASNVNTPSSSKNTSPLVSSGPKNWECSGCWLQVSANDTKCPACGQAKEGTSASAASASSSVFGSNTFGSSSTTTAAPTSTFSFGMKKDTVTNGPTIVEKPATASFGAAQNGLPSVTSSATTTAAPASAAQPERKAWECPTCMINNKATDDKCVACEHEMYKPSAAAQPERKAWECPTCMVNNKATDDKCVACEHVMYKSSESTTTTSAFGSKAFKPMASSGISFGVSSSTSSSAPSTTPSFGFGFGTAAKPASSDASVKDAAPSTGAAAAPSFGFGLSKPATDTPAVPSITVTAAKPNGEKVAAPSLFGASNIAFGSSMPAKENGEKPATTLATPFSTSTSAPSSSIFGAAATSIKPLFGASTTTSTVSATGSTTLSPAKSLFGSSSVFLSNPVSSTSTEPTPAAAVVTSTTPALSMFGSAPTATKPMFGGSLSSTTAINGTAPSPAAPMFGSSAAPSTVPTTAAPLFGASSAAPQPFSIGNNMMKAHVATRSDEDAPAQKRAFSSSSMASTAPAAPFQFGAQSSMPALNGGSTTGFSFGASAPAAAPLPAFGGFGAPAAAAPAPFAAPTEVPAAFNFGAAAPASAGAPFQFGATAAPSASAGSPFQFGQQQAPAQAPAFPSFGAPAAAAGSFGFGGQPSNDSPFAFSSSSASASNAAAAGRKMVAARRRLTKRN